MKDLLCVCGHSMQHVGSSSTTKEGSTWHPLHWKLEVLTTGPPEKSKMNDFDVVISLESQCSPECPRKREQCRALTSKVLAEITSVTPEWNAAGAKEQSLRNHHWTQSCKMLVTNFLWRAQTGTRRQEVSKSDRTRNWRKGLDHKRKPRSRVITEGGSRAEGRCFQGKKKIQKWEILITIKVCEWVQRSSGIPGVAVVKNLPEIGRAHV